jgi:hypothetical protein
MISSSVRLDRISVGSSHVDAREIYPIHKRKIEGYLSKIYKLNAEDPTNKNIPFEIEFNTGRSTLHLENREIVLSNGLPNSPGVTGLNKSRELKRIERIARYYQHTGILPRQALKAKDVQEGHAASQKSVRALNDASLPGANGSLLAGLRVADDSLSLTRNILFAIPDIGPSDPVITHLGYYAGIFWTFFSLRELDEGISEYKRSVSIGDKEGQRRAESRVLSGGIVSAASMGFLSGTFCNSYASGAATAAVLGASNILFGAGSLVALGASILGAVRCERFNNRLNEYLENPSLTDVQKLQGALHFLKDSISVTPEERAELILEIEQKHPDWTAEKKEQLLQQKLADLAEVKVKYMKRRTSNKSLFLILTKADTLLGMLASKNSCAQGIKEASILIHTIQQENRIKLSLYALGCVAALLSLLGTILMSVMTAGLLPFVLFGIAGTIYLAITIYSVAGALIKKEYQMQPLEGVQ